MTSEEFVDIAQIVLPIITLIGIIISMWLSVKALREVQTDRRIRHMPHLVFEPGGYEYPIEFIKIGPSVAGIDPEYAREVFKDIPRGAESICLKIKKLSDGNKQAVNLYGILRNYGTGPALSTQVIWKAEKVKVGVEEFKITDDKLREPRYSREMNAIPASPSNVMPGETANFFRLPTFIQKDFEKKLKEVEGILEIRCIDIFGKRQTSIQEFIIFTDYTSANPMIHMTFGDVLRTF